MTADEINQHIEKDFGWLSPIEKIVMRNIMVKVWNSACDCSAGLVGKENLALTIAHSPSREEITILPSKLSLEISRSIKALKLK